jgi:hypothetical protein
MTKENYIRVEGGKTYTISFWARTENAGGERLPYVRTTQFDEALKATTGTNGGATTIHLPAGTTGWRQYFQPVYTAADTRFLRISSAIDTASFGTVWLDDFELRRMNGALVNVVRTGDTDIRVSSQDGLVVYRENEDYRILDGELNYGSVAGESAYRFYPLDRPTRIELVPTGTIDPSSTVRISYDFLLMPVTGKSHKPHYSINDQRTYPQHVYPYLEEMITTLDPDYALYSGASEVSGINRDSRNANMQNYELLAKDINSVYGKLKAVKPGLKIFLWDDMMNPWHYGNNIYYQSATGGGRVGASEPLDFSLPRVTDLIPRTDIIQWVWQYDEEDNLGKRANSPDYFEGRDFQWLASPRDDLKNIMAWTEIIRGRPACLGMIDWTLRSYEGLEATASYSWNNANLTN